MRHSVRRRDVRFLRRSVDRAAEEQHQCRHGGEGTDQRTYNTLGQHDTHVRAYLQTHETEHQQSYDSREGRRQDGRCSFANSPVGGDDCRSAIGMLILLLTIPVQQHDAVVEREHGLQDRTDEVRRDGYRRQQSVRTHVQHYRQQGCHEDDDGFKPRLSHDEKHQHDHHRRDNHHRHRRRRTVLAGLHYAVATETGADLLAQLLLINGFRHVEIKDGVRAVARIAIGDALHVGIGLQQRSDTRNLFGTHTFEHHMHVRPGHLR